MPSNILYIYLFFKASKHKKNLQSYFHFGKFTLKIKKFMKKRKEMKAADLNNKMGDHVWILISWLIFHM